MRLSTLRSSHPKLLLGRLLTRYEAPAATESVWETMREGDRQKEREREHGGCVLRQGISVSQLLSGWFPERTNALTTLPSDRPKTFYYFLSMSHLRTGLPRARFTSPRFVSCLLSLPSVTLQFQVSGLCTLQRQLRRAN